MKDLTEGHLRTQVLGRVEERVGNIHLDDMAGSMKTTWIAT
jgi:hypothetical protein